MVANDFGFIPDTPASGATNDFGFIPDQTPAASNPSLPMRLVDDNLAGMANVGQYLHNAPYNIANWISPKLAQYMPSPTNINFSQTFGVNNPNLADKALQAAPSIAGMMAGGELAGLAEAPSLLGMVGRNAAFGAGTNVAGGGDALPGAALGAAGGLLGAGINAGVNALRPGNLFSGINPEQLKQNLTAAQGTTTPLGNVIGSPYLQRFSENILPKVPFSGSNTSLQQTGNQVVDQGNNLMSQLLGNNSAGDVGQTLQNTLKDKLSTLQDMKRANFALPNDLADGMNLNIGRTNFAQAAQNALDEINQSPELAKTMDPAIIKNLTDFSSNLEGNTLKNSNIFKSKIGGQASNYFADNQPYEYGIYRNLKNGLDQDITEGIANSGDDTLQNAHDNAMQFYKDNIAPFEDPNIVKFTKQGGDADTLLSTFIKNGGINDRGNLIDTLVNKLPDNQKTLPAYGYFSKSLDNQGNVNPLQMANQWNRLGAKQQTALIPDANLRQQMTNYSQLTNMNRKALSTMYNPMTGQQVMDVLPSFGIGSAGAAIGGIPGAAASLLGSALAGRGLNSLLTNESVRNSIANSMLEGAKNAPVVGNKFLGMTAGAPAIWNSQ